MTTILSWNIQYSVGMDGSCDPERIARIARSKDPDVVCFQEVPQFWPELDAGRGEDQVAKFAKLFSGWSCDFGVSVEWRRDDGRVSRFGNLILSRLPVQAVETHLLPRPALSGVKHMRRSLLHVVLRADFGALLVATTHLEFSSDMHRLAQIERIRNLHDEFCSQHESPPLPGLPGKPFAVPLAPTSMILCGDFNCLPESPALGALTAPLRVDVPRLADAWATIHGTAKRDATCNVHAKAQASEPADVMDYFFVSEDLIPRLGAVRVDLKTDASDHQPLWVELRDEVAT